MVFLLPSQWAMAAHRRRKQLDELRRRRQAIRWYLRGIRFTEICERLDRHSTWLSKWLKRYHAEGCDGLRERSRRPHRFRAQTSPYVVNEIVALRGVLEVFSERAKGAGAIRRVLLTRHGDAPSVSTVERILRRHFETRRKRRARRRQRVRQP
jgi:hypothetical protein